MFYQFIFSPYIRKKRQTYPPGSYGYAYLEDNYYYEYEDLDVDSYDDCFDDIPEPLYGFRVRVKLIEDQVCDLETTCIATANRTSSTTFNTAQERQTGEAFASDAPPDCRVNFG